MEQTFQTPWCLWEHKKNTGVGDYAGSIIKIATIYSIKDFWEHFNNYPKPSILFYNGITKATIYDIDISLGSDNEREISSVCLFRDGIEPKWEDPKNTKGGEIAIRKFNSFAEMDKFWTILTTMCVGEQISEHITGIRVVDSSVEKKKKILHRIEIWFDDVKYRKQIQEIFCGILGIRVNDGDIFFKEHSTSKVTYRR